MVLNKNLQVLTDHCYLIETDSNDNTTLTKLSKDN